MVDWMKTWLFSPASIFALVIVVGGSLWLGVGALDDRAEAKARAAGRVGPARALEWAKKFGAREDRIDCIDGPTWRGTWRCAVEKDGKIIGLDCTGDACVMTRCTP